MAPLIINEVIKKYNDLGIDGVHLTQDSELRDGKVCLTLEFSDKPAFEIVERVVHSQVKRGGDINEVVGLHKRSKSGYTQEVQVFEDAFDAVKQALAKEGLLSQANELGEGKKK